jgi:hypothetical protein
MHKKLGNSFKSHSKTIMSEFIKETVTTQENTSTPNSQVTPAKTNPATQTQSIGYIIYFIFGALEMLLAFRFFLKLAGASLSSSFVGFIYNLSGIFVMPFEGIFRRGTTQGIETTAIFEPASFIAILVYMIIAWGLVKLVVILAGEKEE